ncbi:hypothetical protein Tco_1016704 [Tanacetum coccineum]|uniref:Uncharacterized protein n=1 Tax=Tanacetum coccineum TaxID=301880 RepID=A0ABQ5FQF1_9ASTR
MACNQMSDCNPFFKEKGSVRFSALYLKKKRNLLVFTSVDMIVMTSMVELESLFGHLFDELSNGENQVVSKSSDVTTADAFDKRQQQQDSTSSTSTLATTITADGNFDLIYKRRTKKIMETMNVTFDELSAAAFEQSSSKPELQGMTSGQISSGLDLTYALSTITSQKPAERELDLLFEAMYDDNISVKTGFCSKNCSDAQHLKLS